MFKKRREIDATTPSRRDGSTPTTAPEAPRRLNAVLVLRTPKTSPPLEVTAAEVLKTLKPWSYEAYLGAYQASAEDVKVVKAFATRRGLTVTEVNRAWRTVTLEGGVEQLEKAFGVELQAALSSAPVRVYVGTISVPKELHQIVQLIFELEIIPLMIRPGLIPGRAVPAPSRPPQPVTPPPITPPTVAPVTVPMNPAPWQEHSPPDFARFYEYPEELTGKGVCVGVIECYGGYRREDMERFFGDLGIPMPEIEEVGPNLWGRGGSAWANFEATMDVQVVASCAPGARVVVYFSDAYGDGDTTVWTMFKVLSTAIFDAKNRPQVLSMSLGIPELFPEAWAKPEAELINELFISAAILGITACVASGDSGSIYPMGQGMFAAPSSVYFPSSSPWVLACGGTALEVKNGEVRGEQVWNQLERNMILRYGDQSSLQNMGSSTGGVSAYFALPEWQKDAQVPAAFQCTMDEFILSEPSTYAGRGCPDISANADFFTSYRFFCDGKYRNGGGTSAATPLIAALMARLNEGLGRRVGFVAPLLYKLQLVEKKEVLTPISVGNNGGYSTDGAGWNACTGLGSPRGRAMFAELKRVFDDRKKS